MPFKKAKSFRLRSLSPKKWGLIMAGSALGLIGLMWAGRQVRQVMKPFRLHHQDVVELLREPIKRHHFPSEFSLGTHPKDQTKGKTLYAQYTLDHDLQSFVDSRLSAYGPDHATVVVLDANTGRVLVLGSYQREAPQENLSIEARFPAASLFKIVTAAAAIETQGFNPDTRIPYNGSNHTLYRKNVLSDQVNRWTRLISLKDAFAKSVNSVFGKLGLFRVGPGALKVYAERLGFNQTLQTDFPVEDALFFLPDNDDWAVVEAASGYTSRTTLGPVHGAMMAAAVVGNGTLKEPYLVETMVDANGEEVYTPHPRPVRQVFLSSTAQKMRELMEETVISGTSRKAFRGFGRKFDMGSLEIGGKTGSLDGQNPKGRHDWFAGFVKDGDRSLAICVLAVNEKKWRVKSSQLAREIIEYDLRRN